MEGMSIVCACGCGGTAPPFTEGGRPRRFIHGHNTIRVPVANRFWAKVNKGGPIQPHCPELGPCWVWTNAVTDGYGVLSRDGTRQLSRAHRISWELHHGAIPSGAQVLHHCDNRPCVNPAHLFLGTQQDNVDDMWAKGRASLANRAMGSANGSAKLTESDAYMIRERYAKGYESHRQIAREYGVTATAIQAITTGRWWRHVGGPLVGKQSVGESMARRKSKLSAAAVIDIRASHVAGEPQSAIAQRHGVDPSAISKVIHRKAWKHVP